MHVPNHVPYYLIIISGKAYWMSYTSYKCAWSKMYWYQHHRPFSHSGQIFARLCQQARVEYSVWDRNCWCQQVCWRRQELPPHWPEQHHPPVQGCHRRVCRYTSRLVTTLYHLRVHTNHPMTHCFVHGASTNKAISFFRGVGVRRKLWCLGRLPFPPFPEWKCDKGSV